MIACRLLTAPVLLLVAWASGAHPLGNATINRQAAIQVTANAVELRYLLDLAEIPALAEAAEADADGDGQTTPGEWQARAERWLAALPAQLRLEWEGAPLRLTPVPRSLRWSLAPGAADLPVLRIEARLRAALPGPGSRLAYADRDRPEHPGWKEVFVTAAGGAAIESTDAAREDRSRGLTEFPGSALAGAPDRTRAEVRVRLPRPAAAARRAPAPATPPQLQAEPPSLPATTVAFAATESTASAPAATPSPWAFFRLGVHHIATGWDHLVFLLGLLLLRQPLGRLVGTVTAFTLAHSLTLALAAGGWVAPPSALVEAAIAGSIVWVGWMALARPAAGHGPALAFGFGLVHGLGFAGALAESLDGALSGASWIADLAAFNAGIEAFQLLVVLTVAPLLAAAARTTWSAPARTAASLAVLGSGMGWFFTRTLGVLA